MINLLRARLACHGTVVCCQYTDGPMCNSAHDPHLLGRLYRRYAQMRDRWADR